MADLEFWKGGFQYAIKARVARVLKGFGSVPPGKFYDFLLSEIVSGVSYSQCEIAKSWTTYYY